VSALCDPCDGEAPTEARLDPDGARKIVTLYAVGLRDVPDRHPLGEFRVTVSAPVDRMDGQPDAKEDGNDQCEPEGGQETAVLPPQVLDVAERPEARS